MVIVILSWCAGYAAVRSAHAFMCPADHVAVRHLCQGPFRWCERVFAVQNDASVLVLRVSWWVRTTVANSWWRLAAVTAAR